MCSGTVLAHNRLLVTVKDRLNASQLYLQCYHAMLLFACLSGLCRAFYVTIGRSLCGSHGQLWLGSSFSLRLGHVLAMLAPGQALCQHFVVQMICKTPDTSWS